MQRRGRFETVAARHLDVEERNIGPDREGGWHDIIAAPDLGDDLDISSAASSAASAPRTIA